MPEPNVIAETVDLTEMGAVPMHANNGPRTDNAPVFNRLLGKLGRGVAASVPLRGRYRICDTLASAQRYSAAFDGTAGSFASAEATYESTYTGGATCGFVWEGPLDRPMFRAKGSSLRFTGVHFQGATAPLHASLLAKPAAVCGILVEPNQNGLATGYVHLDSCSFACLQTAIQCGLDDPVAHNAEGITSSGNLWISHCGTFLRVRNNQSVAHNLQMVNLWNTGVGFSFERGGGLTVSSCEVVGGPTLLLQTDRVDINTGKMVFGNVKLDPTSNGCQVLKMLSAAPLHLTMGLHVGNGITSSPLFTMRGAARIRLLEVMGLPGKAFSCPEGEPHILIDGGTTRRGVKPLTQHLMLGDYRREPVKRELYEGAF